MTLIIITVTLLFGVPGLLLLIAKLVGLNGPDRRSGRLIGYPLDVPASRPLPMPHEPGAPPPTGEQT